MFIKFAKPSGKVGSVDKMLKKLFRKIWKYTPIPIKNRFLPLLSKKIWKYIPIPIKYRFLPLYKGLKKEAFYFPFKFHLGCGGDYLKDWINIDVNKFSTADIVCDFKYLNKYFPNDSVSVIKMIHSISYLRLWEARDFFAMCFKLLKKNGTLILEFPDIVKCAKLLIENEKTNFENYILGTRGIYAFSLRELELKKKNVPYTFGWSAHHIENELLKTGYSFVKITDLEKHGKLDYRDTRIEAIK